MEVQGFKPQHYHTATVGPLSKALNRICSPEAIPEQALNLCEENNSLYIYVTKKKESSLHPEVRELKIKAILLHFSVRKYGISRTFCH